MRDEIRNGLVVPNCIALVDIAGRKAHITSNLGSQRLIEIVLPGMNTALAEDKTKEIEKD